MFQILCRLKFPSSLLGGLEVPMDDFVEVEVVHATCNAHWPVNQEGGGDFAARPQHLVQLSLGAVFHQDTVTRSLGAHAPGRKHSVRLFKDIKVWFMPPNDKRPYRISWLISLESDDVGVLEFAEVFDLGLFDVPHFLYRHVFSVELAEEDGALCPAAHPLQVRDFLKRNLPGL